MGNIQKTTLAQYQAIVAEILTEAKKHGATQAEAAASVDIGLHATARLGKVEVVEFTRDKNIGITVYKDQQKGSVNINEISSKAIQEAVKKACQIAKFTEKDDCAGLAAPERMATQIPDLDLYHPQRLTAEQAIGMAIECEAIGLEADPKIVNSEGASISSSESHYVYGNSHGFLGAFPSTTHSLSCVLIGKENDAMQRDYDYTVARDPQELRTGQQVAQSAATRTLSRLGARKIKTCQAPVLFEPQVAKSMISHFIQAISGGNLYRRSSFLLDQLDKVVFPSKINMIESPLLPKALGSVPFDQEGVAVKERNIVSEGRLASYVLGSYSARKLGMETTGNAGGVHNLSMSHDGLDFNALLQQMGTGLLVTELMGHGVNITTGDYSRGAAGFWVESGQIQFPVEEITIAGQLKDLFLNLVAVGNDIDKRGNILSGSLLFDSMTIAGN